jgi:hypothetical protein
VWRGCRSGRADRAATERVAHLMASAALVRRSTLITCPEAL